MSSRKFLPQERLGDFIQNREASQDAVELLRNFLSAYEPTYRSRIINAQLTQFYNRTSVHLAAEKGVAPFLRILLQHGGNPNVESSLADLKQTPLHLAAEGGFWQCMELLLEYGAKLNVEDMRKRTPCDHIRGRPKCTLVVTHHIAKSAIPNRNQNEEDTVQSLHKMIEDDKKTEQFKEIYSHLLNHYQDLATRWLDLETCTLLYRACYHNCEEAVKLMLRLSEHTPLANFNHGDTPLNCACSNGNIRLVEMLLDHSPRLALVCDTIMDRHYSPLHIACMEKGNNKVVEIILQKILLLLEAADEYSEDSPLDLNVCDAYGCTPLYYACYYGHDEIVSSLLKFGHQHKNCKPLNFDISTTLQQCTPLHAAVQRNRFNTLHVILNCYVNQAYTLKELVNFAGPPSIDTKFRLLNCFPSARSSVVSTCTITSQDADNMSPVEKTQKQISQKLSSVAIHPVKSKPGSRNLQFKSSKPTPLPSEVKTRAATLVPTTSPTILQQKSEVKLRQRSKTEYNLDRISLIMTKDGSFQVHSTEQLPENFDKSFDELFITPLAEACACGYSDVVNTLLSAGARDTGGMAVRLAQLTRNYELARIVLCHHCKLIVENPSSDQPLYALAIDWSGMKMTDLVGSWFVEESIFFPSSAEDEDGRDVPMTSLSIQPSASMLTNVVLKENNLSLLPVELFQLPNLESLDVSSNHITSISSNISSNSLKFLCLSNNKLIKLPVTIWYLANLEELRVKENILQELEEKKDSVDPSKLSGSLKVVDISKNKLNVLPPFVLELPVLEELNVSQNTLTKLPSNIWQSCTLRELNASNNKLTDELLSYESQATPIASLPDSNAALRYGKRVVGARMNARFQTNDGINHRRHTTRFVNSLETPREVYSEEYIYLNEGCCGIKKMLLSGNKLSMFPDALPCLAPLLIELDVSRNSIEEIDILFLPPILKKLVASNNKIKKFGNFIDPKLKDQMMRSCCMVCVDNQQQQECHHRIHKNMKYLAIIDLAHNQIKHCQLMQSEQAGDTLPNADFSQFDLLYPELENLNISHNCLQGCFNHNIGYQSQLKSITLDGNAELEELPMEFSHFKKSKKFTQLSLYNLPKLRDPPKEYHNKLRPLLSYMSSRLKNSVDYRFIKLIVVGCGARGKTTLLRRLRGLPYDNVDSTVGIDIEPWTYGQPTITFITWDFAGQDIYNTTHQCFYSQRSLYLALYRLNDEGGVAELDSWLRNIKLRAPGSPVIVIGTHLDQVTDAIAKKSEARVREQYKNDALYPTIVDVCSISCTKKGYFKKVIRSTIDQLRTTIYQVATHLRVAPDGLKLTYDPKMSSKDPESLFQQKIPQSYLKLQESVINTLKTNEKLPVMRSDEFRDTFLSIMDDEEELSDAVQYLHHQGTLLHFTDQALKFVYFLDPQWLCKLMASVIRVPPAGKESLVKNGFVDIKNLFTELQAFKDECINLLSKFDIALRLKNHQLLVPSLLPVDPLKPLPLCTRNELLTNTHSSNSENIIYPPLLKFWFSKFIPNGFWPRLICQLTTNQNINKILKSVFPLLLDDCGPHSSKDDTFLPWTLWRSGLAFTYKETLLLEVKEMSRLNKNNDTSVKDDSQLRVEACVNIPGWVTVTKQLNSQDIVADQDIAGHATSIMVEIVKHISSLATHWFPGMFTGYLIEDQVPCYVPCYVPCWKCCYQCGDNVEDRHPCLEQGMAAVSIERNGHTVYCWEFDKIIIPAIKGKSLWCDVHCSIDPRQLTPELFFRDLGDYDKDYQQPLWIDKERPLGKGAFGVVLRGKLEIQNEKVAIKVLLPEADSKLEHSTLEQVLQTASDDSLIPQSYHDVRQEVSILSRLHHDNLAKLCGVRTTSIISGTTPTICLLLELAQESNLREVLKRYRAAKLLLEPVTLKATICQIASGLDYLHQHDIAHLDIKSPNILVWKFPLQFNSRQDRLKHATEVHVKIADYGTSQISMLHGIKANNSVGTPGYMAPELFSQKGQEISPYKVDVFAFGMTIFELLSMRPPFDDAPQKDVNTLHKLVREGKRPLLTDKEIQSPVLIQEVMQMCWEHEPNNRPSMSQILQWAESIEFDSLRVDSNLAQVKAISTACVSRIDPAFDSHLEYNSDDVSYTLMKSQTITQHSVTKSVTDSCTSDDTENSTIQPRGSRDMLGKVFRRVGSMSEILHSSAQTKPSACSQIWLCGRDKRKGLVTIFTYEDDKPGYSLFYGYACEQEIKVICAVHNYMWLGNANGELRIIHATTMKTQFVRSLNTKDSTSACILDIVHVKADHKVMVSTLNCDVWIFLDVLDKGGLRLHSHLKFSDELLHMTVVDVNGSPEVWGTYSDKKVMVFQHHQSKWDYSVLQCEPFSDGRLYTVALATSSVFTGKHGDTKSHVWVSFNRRAYIVCWDAVEKKQLHVLNCKTDMQIDKQGLEVSSLLASGQYVYVGTTVGVIGVWSSEDAKMLECFHYHEHKVRMLLKMPLQVSPCVCPEVPFPKDKENINDDSVYDNSSHLITSIGNGRKRLLPHSSSTSDKRRLQVGPQRHDDDICLLTWQCWK